MFSVDVLPEKSCIELHLCRHFISEPCPGQNLHTNKDPGNMRMFQMKPN